MEVRIFILSVACFSCLIPPALSTGILAAKAAKAAIVGKGALLAKGAIAKVALAKGALIKGALAKGAVIAKGALAAKGAAIAKGAMLAKGALAAKGALIAKGALAAKGLLLAKKALAAKGIMLAKGAAVGLAAKAAMAAKAAAVKGAALIAKGVAAKGAAILAGKGAAVKGAALLAAKGAAVKGAAITKAVTLGALLSKPVVQPIPVAPPLAHWQHWVRVPSFIPIPLLPSVRRSVMMEYPTIPGRIAEWAGAIKNSLMRTTDAATDLVSAVGTRAIAAGSSPAMYEVASPLKLYPAPVIEKVEPVQLY